MSYTKTTWVNNTTPINETNLNKIESGIKNNDINIGEENYDNTKTYEVGDIVRYNEKIYKCITAITTAENFDISKWEQTNIVEIVQSEKSKIYELIEAISTPIVGEGEYITLNDTAEKRFEKFDIEGNSKQEATPSPDYPSEVKSCGSNVNLIEETFEGYNINAKGAFEKTNGYDMQIAKLKANIKYTLNADTYVFGYYNEKPTIASITYDKSKVVLPQSLNTIIPTRDGYISFRTDKTDNNKKIKLVEGTEVGEYSPYGQGCINEVVFNIQMFNKANEIVGQLINSSGVASTNENWNTSEYISVKKGSTICWSYETVGAGQLTINEFNDAKSFIKQTYADYRNNNGNELVVTLSNDTSYVRVGYRNDLTCDNLVLEYGNKRSGSREYKESQTYTIPTQQPFRSIGDTRDKFILKENGKWYEHHPVIRKIFDGTENWTFNESSINPFGVVLSGVTKLTDSQSNAPNCISNYFTTVAWSETASGGKFYESEFLMTSLTDNNLRIRNNNYSTLNDFKSWLAEQYNARTPVYVDYILKTPLDIECTSEQTEILNQMYIKAKSYKGVTHIHSNDEVSPNCYVEAVKDLTTLIQ